MTRETTRNSPAMLKYNKQEMLKYFFLCYIYSSDVVLVSPVIDRCAAYCAKCVLVALFSIFILIDRCAAC